MTDQPYTKRELDLKFKELHEKLDEIIVQTTKTNGSVMSLKAWRFGINLLTAGALIIVLPLLIYAYSADKQFLTKEVDGIRVMIQSHINQK